MANTIEKLLTDGTGDLFEYELQAAADRKKDEQRKLDAIEGVYELQEIEVTKIVDREVNDYLIGDIEELAMSIKENELQQPIIVRKKDDKYILIAGHRRVKAFKYLKETTGDNKWDLIFAKVYSQISDKQEQAIYEQTNDTQRVNTLFERVWRLNPRNHFFNNDNTKDANKMAEYLELKVKSGAKKFDIDDSNLKVIAQQQAEIADRMWTPENQDFISVLADRNGKTFNIYWDGFNTMVDYIILKLQHKYKDVKIGTTTVKTYCSNIMGIQVKELITKYIFGDNPKLKPYDLTVIYKMTEEEQRKLFELLESGGTWKKPVSEVEEKETEVNPEQDFDAMIKSTLKKWNKWIEANEELKTGTTKEKNLYSYMEIIKNRLEKIDNLNESKKVVGN